jgi:hypothetical protein
LPWLAQHPACGDQQADSHSSMRATMEGRERCEVPCWLTQVDSVEVQAASATAGLIIAQFVAAQAKAVQGGVCIDTCH